MSAIDFSDDPRAVLVHFNEKHDRLGRFAKKSGGSSGSYINPLEIEAQKPGEKNGLFQTRLDSQDVVIKAVNTDETIDQIVRKMVDVYVRPEAVRESSFLRSKIGNSEYHSQRDYIDAGMAISDTVYKDIQIAMRTGMYGLMDDKDDKDTLDKNFTELMKILDDEKVREKITKYAGERLREVYDTQQHHGSDHLTTQSREKEVSGSASAKRRVMNADQAYKLASEQRSKDIKRSYESKSASEAYAKASNQRKKDLEKKLKHVDYTDDPRAVLIHFNKNHDPKTGQFTSGSSFGIGKYIDSKGNLTEEGKKRLDHDLKRNYQKKKDDQVKDKDGKTAREILTDPHRWVREDLNEIESGLKAAGTLTGDVEKILKSREAKRPLVRKKRMNLKDMTDTELNAEINRYLLEQRYQDIFNPKEPPEVSKGKKFLMNALEVTGGVLAVGASAVTIAKALHELKKGS